MYQNPDYDINHLVPKGNILSNLYFFYDISSTWLKIKQNIQKGYRYKYEHITSIKEHR